MHIHSQDSFMHKKSKLKRKPSLFTFHLPDVTALEELSHAFLNTEHNPESRVVTNDQNKH